MTVTMVTNMVMNAEYMYHYARERLLVRKQTEKENVLNAIYESAKNGEFAVQYMIQFDETKEFLKNLGYCVEWIEHTPRHNICWLPEYIAEQQSGD